MKENDIVYELNGFFIVRAPKGFDIYENAVTHSERVARCGYHGKKGLDWCRDEIDRRIQFREKRDPEGKGMNGTKKP